MSYDNNSYRTIQALKEENDRLRKILEYYTDQSNWKIETRDVPGGLVAEFNPDDVHYEDGKWVGGKKAIEALR